MVDIEDFMIGLCRYLHVWMGNTQRAYGFSLCFTEKIEAGDSLLSASLDFETVRYQSNLISLGYQVENIDNAVDRILSKGKNMKMDIDREYIHNLGIFQRFYDEMNAIEVDVFCKKEDYEAIAKRGDKLLEIIKKGDRKEEKMEKKNVVKDVGSWEIDFNHLKGTSKNLSVGAIHHKMDSMEMYDKKGKKKFVEKKEESEVKKDKKLKLPKLGSSHL